MLAVISLNVTIALGHGYYSERQQYFHNKRTDRLKINSDGQYII